MTDDLLVFDIETDITTVREWLPQIRINAHLLAQSEDIETMVTFRVANGPRTYRVVSYAGNGIFVLELQGA